MLRSSRLQRREAGLEIFLDRQQRKDLAALRHLGDAAPGALVRPQRGDVVRLPSVMRAAR